PLRADGSGLLRRLRSRQPRDDWNRYHHHLDGHRWHPDDCRPGTGEARGETRKSHRQTRKASSGVASRKRRAEGPVGGARAKDGKIARRVLRECILCAAWLRPFVIFWRDARSPPVDQKGTERDDSPRLRTRSARVGIGFLRFAVGRLVKVAEA